LENLESVKKKSHRTFKIVRYEQAIAVSLIISIGLRKKKSNFIEGFAHVSAYCFLPVAI